MFKVGAQKAQAIIKKLLRNSHSFQSNELSEGLPAASKNDHFVWETLKNIRIDGNGFFGKKAQTLVETARIFYILQACFIKPRKCSERRVVNHIQLHCIFHYCN